MDTKRIKTEKPIQRLLEKVAKYKYALLILLLGAGLMLFPTKQTQTAAVQENPAPTQSAQAELTAVEAELSELLSQVEGAGRTKVMLSLEYGTENSYQMDIQESKQENSSTRESETVFYQTDNSQHIPVVTRTKYPVYKGAVIVCEGADRASVKLAVVQAVSRLTGLGSDKISVMKMKQK